MNTLVWLLGGILLYTVGAMALNTRGMLPDSFRVNGPILTIHTKRGRVFLNRLAAPKRIWRAWGNLGLGIAIVIMVGSFLAVLLSAISVLLEPTATSRLVRPQDALVIPGVNRFLPWEAAVPILVGLVVGLIVHEGGHGLLCRVEDIEIDSMGIALLAFIPLGAFVQPDEESQESADRGGRSRMFAAGVTNNFLVTAITFALLFGIIASLVTVVPGVAVGGVLPGSAAEDAGIERGDVLTAVNGQTVTGEDEFETELAGADREVEIDRENADPVTVEREIMVTRAVVDAPVGAGTTITAIDGETVYTRAAFTDAIDDREVVVLETPDGAAPFPVGVFVSTVPESDPLGSAGAPDTPMLLHSVGGESTATPAELSAVLSGYEPGETVTVVAYHSPDTSPWRGDRHTYQVELGSHPTEEYGYLGVGGIQDGISGVVVDDIGIDTYPADQYHALLGGTGWGNDPVTTFISRTFAVLVLPFASIVDPSLGYNFAGFNSDITNFYAVSGPLSAGVVFALANVLFWTGWVNINLGMFNCIPSYPLDGGHILRSCVEAVLARVPGETGSLVVTTVTAAISVTMILSLLAMLFLPQLLG